MKTTIFDNPNFCTENFCDKNHCCICGCHVLAPKWGKAVCKVCIKARHDAQINGTLTQDDINKWEGAFRVTEVARVF